VSHTNPYRPPELADAQAVLAARTFMRMERAPGLTGLWGQIALGADVTGVLSPAHGGTGLSSVNTGALVYGGPTAFGVLNNLTVGAYLRGAGTSTPPTWSNVTLPDAATTGDLLYASNTNTYSNLAGVAAGRILRAGGVGVAPAWSTATYPATAGTTANVLRSDGTNFLSAALAAVDLSNGVTGSGSVVLANTPTLITPVLGAATGTSVNLSSTATASAFIPTSSTVPANGMYLAAASTVALSTGSAERVRIDSSGNVGVGTTPTKALHVTSGNFSRLVRIQASADTTAAVEFKDTGTGANLPCLGSAGNGFFIETGGTERLRVDSAGQVILQTVGTGLSIKEGSNAKQGKSTMTAGAVTVSTTAVTSSSRIFISINDAGSGALTNIGSVYVNNIVAGTSFDIRSTNVLDTSSVVWLITEPS
jgi:hypothetical protein